MDLVGFYTDGVYMAEGKPDGTFGNIYKISSNYSTDQGWSSAYYYPRYMDDVNGDGIGDIIAFGDDGVYVSLGLYDNDQMIGGEGNDTLKGGRGADILNGGAGVDLASYAEATSGVNLSLLMGVGTDGDALGDTFLDIENVEGSAWNDVLQGNNDDNLLLGSSGNDSLEGLGGNDTLDGGAGIDTLRGGAGNDTYLVGDAGDVIVENAGEGTDEVRTALASYILAANVENLVYTGTVAFTGTGNTGNNSITGGSGNDSLTGDFGNDTLDGGVGADTLLGGTGNDTYIVDNVGDIVTELTGEGTDTVRTGLASYTLGANVENLIFTGSGPFTGTGNALNNSLTGGSGADLLTGLDGNDTLNGGAGADTLIGGSGNDLYVIDNVGDVLIELPGEGTDTVQSSINHALLANFENLALTGSAAIDGTGNAANNLLTGNGGANLLTGLDGDDTLNGGAGADTLVGGTGNDLYVVDNTGDVVTELAGEGTDTVNASVSWALGANLENLTLTGSAAINATGNELNNVLTGNSAANILDGGLGDDSMAGGGGNDVYIVDSSGDVVTEAVNQGLDEVRTGLAGYTLGANVEHLTYIGAAAFTGTGNALDNRLIGGVGADTLFGDAGNDTLDGGAGDDSLVGGLGNDLYLVDNSGDVVVELSGEGSDEVRTGLAAYSLGDNVEALTYAGSGSFTGTGNALDNQLTGGTGNDTLSGGDGADTLTGGIGDDSLIGGTGNDLYFVDSLGDQVIELAGEGTDEVRTGLAVYTLSDNVETLSYTGSGNFAGTGNALANLLQGGAGNDTLDGGLGADTLVGGGGNDVYRVDDAGDVVVEVAGAGIDEVRTSLASYLLGAEVESLTFEGTGSFAGTGNGLDNRLTGGAGNDALDGVGGNDTLQGGTGDDLLAGGLGADLFQFAAGDGQDTIGDFDASQGDRIGLATGVTWTVGSNAIGDAQILFGMSDVVTLTGVQASAVSSTWFVTV